MAYTDALTGLSNRLAFRELLDARVLRLNGVGRELALLFADIDDFKRVNDTLGHDAGDEVLLQFAHRISQVVADIGGPDAKVARFGGDEFVVARAGASRSELEGLAQGLVEAVRSVVRDLGLDALVSTSVGVVVSKPGASAEDLVREADVAMYQAKGAGKDCWRFLDEEAQAVDVDTANLRKDLRVALETGTIEVHYQPVTTIVNAIRDLLAQQPVGTDIWIALAWCVGILIVAYGFAMVTYRRKLA